MSKAILIIIKIVAIIFVAVLMGISHKMGVPIIIKNLIGFAIIFAIWKYKPEEPKNNDNHHLDKS